MAPRRTEILALLPILEDPNNADRDSEELARLLINKLDQVREAAKHDRWQPVYPTHAERQIAFTLARLRARRGWNPWAHYGPACHCGLAVQTRCPRHPERKT